ncbi:unnamed protein product, partial [Musa banksii]
TRGLLIVVGSLSSCCRRYCLPCGCQVFVNYIMRNIVACRLSANSTSLMLIVSIKAAWGNGCRRYLGAKLTRAGSK